MAQKKYKFSVIIPIYNVEQYLSEALDSVINQSLSFKENVQLVLINDGSPDNSESICVRYRDMYPENIVYIKQKNGGVSAARNKGLEVATGEYIGFLDPDDKVSRNAYQTINDFIEKNSSVGVFSYSIHFFGSVKGPHAVNDKFNDGSRVVDLNDKDNRFIQSNVASVFIRRDLIGDTLFDKKLKYGEDGKFINTILLKDPRLGLVAEAKYFYRKRGDGTSAVDGMTKDQSWYFDLINHYLIEMAKASIKKNGVVIKYIQNIILHDLRWRFQQQRISQSILDNDLQVKYRDTVKSALDYVDDDTILSFEYIRKDLRAFILQFKYGIEDFEIENEDNKNIYIGPICVDTLFEKRSVFVDIIERKENGALLVEGWYEGVVNKQRKLIATYGSKRIEVELRKRQSEPLYSLGVVARYRSSFTLMLSSEEVNTGGLLGFHLETPDYHEPVPIIFGYHSRISSAINHSYRKLRDTLLTVDYSKGYSALRIEKDTLLKRIKNETQVSLRILSRKDRLSFGARIAGWCIRKILSLFGKKVWLFIDRPLTATDNAYAMYKYVLETKQKNVFPVFVLAKESHDREALKQLGGTVVDFGAALHKVFLFASNKVLSAHFDGFAFNPYAHRSTHMRIGLDFDLVYLQHGVLAADLSDLINKHARNIKLITASSDSERESIITNANYGYSEQNVAVTGQARFDEQIEGYLKGSKVILLTPTWRHNLVAPPKNVKGRVLPGRNEKSASFKNTEYFKFYEALINDERLLEKIRDSGYKLRFCLHPQIAAQLDDFTISDDRVEILASYDYNEVLKDAAMMVTDYSGVAFDFAYTKRPLVYAQYDLKDFYDGHTYDAGYFSFKRDGFGPVVETVESTIEEIIANIDNDMKVNDRYAKRVTKFFKYSDANSRKRIFKAINELDGYDERSKEG